MTTRGPTSDPQWLAHGVSELNRVEQIAHELHAGCCQPLRSPRMEVLVSTVQAARHRLSELDDEKEPAIGVIAMLEEAGAQLGHLQVACCTPSRVRLYTEALEHLGKTQRLITRALDLDH